MKAHQNSDTIFQSSVITYHATIDAWLSPWWYQFPMLALPSVPLCVVPPPAPVDGDAGVAGGQTARRRQRAPGDVLRVFVHAAVRRTVVRWNSSRHTQTPSSHNALNLRRIHSGFFSCPEPPCHMILYI